MTRNTEVQIERGPLGKEALDLSADILRRVLKSLGMEKRDNTVMTRLVMKTSSKLISQLV